MIPFLLPGKCRLAYMSGSTYSELMRRGKISLKRKRLEAKGWEFGNADTFLGLSAAESDYIDLKIKLADSLRQLRLRRDMSQVELARLLKSSQSRVAKMEAGDPTVSLDLLVRSLLALGASQKDLIQAIKKHRTAPTTYGLLDSG